MQRCTFMWWVSKLLYVLESRLLGVKDISLEHSMFTERFPLKQQENTCFHPPREIQDYQAFAAFLDFTEILSCCAISHQST